MHVHVQFTQGKSTKVIHVDITQRTRVHESSLCIERVAEFNPPTS